MTVDFPFGKSVQLLRRLPGGSFSAPVVINGCMPAPRPQPEAPVPSWPPVTSGRELYAPVGTVVASRDRMVVEGVTYEVDGDMEVWDSPFAPTRFGVRIYLRRADNWFDTEVVVRTYLGSSGMGSTWDDAVSWPANLVSVASMTSSGTGDESGSKVTVRVPPEHEGALAVEVFTPGSVLAVAGRDVTVNAVTPLTRDGFTEFVEVSAQ